MSDNKDAAKKEEEKRKKREETAKKLIADEEKRQEAIRKACAHMHAKFEKEKAEKAAKKKQSK
ncbi:hypothetical protein QR685DRAFT_65391 [Neurospora intermedia]|uniref:Uncharacterized protein n=1 Tax=Neurospora intermedia TaxID=5142 RepID=A0ABR3DTI3_NEUIN